MSKNVKTLLPVLTGPKSCQQRFVNVRLLSTTSKRCEDDRPAQSRKPVKTDALQNVGEEFRTFKIEGFHASQKRDRFARRRFSQDLLPPRYTSMPIDQDWTNVWPTAASFNWSIIPFPVRQGFVERNENKGVPPVSYGNAELRKIPNFLHLTPGHIQKQCQAIKKFCTPWPKGLEKDTECDNQFPVSVETRDYCFAGPSILDERARNVTVKLNIKALKLNKHAKDKIIRLLRDGYNKKSGEITLHTSRCPLKKQNYDYAIYLLTACYFEANKKEAWEVEKTRAETVNYLWKGSPSQQNLEKLLSRIQEADTQITSNTESHMFTDFSSTLQTKTGTRGYCTRVPLPDDNLSTTDTESDSNNSAPASEAHQEHFTEQIEAETQTFSEDVSESTSADTNARSKKNVPRIKREKKLYDPSYAVRKLQNSVREIRTALEQSEETKQQVLQLDKYFTQITQTEEFGAIELADQGISDDQLIASMADYYGIVFVFRSPPMKHLLIKTFKSKIPDVAVEDLLTVDPEIMSQTVSQSSISSGVVKQYSQAVEAIHNVGETDSTLDKYKQAVLQLLNIDQQEVTSAQNKSKVE